MITARTGFLVGLFVAAVLGCAPAPMMVGSYRVSSAPGKPNELDKFPHTAFAGDEAYLVGNDWLYRDRTYGWVVFDQEPPELRAVRERTYGAEAQKAK